ncbi:MAG: N-succinylarginine dihydrolase, partial [Oceanococcaceae bacterium]
AQAAKEAVFAAAASAGLAPPRWVVAPEQAFGLEEAVQSYLFNSQLLDGPDGRIWLLGSDTIAESPGVLAWLEGLVS